MTPIEIDEPSTPDTPPETRIRRRRRSRGPRVLRTAGLALIVAGSVVLAWLGWQFWGTNWVSHQRQAEVVQRLQEDWGNGDAYADTDFGRATGILRVPRFGEDYQIPILEGSSDEVLAAGIGHLDDTADVGEVGNYALAAHRITHGEPFANLPDLGAGDLVYVDTLSTTYTYVLDTGGHDLVVPFTDSWVIDPFPRNPAPDGATPPGDVGKHLITLLTCSEIFHTDNRTVVFGHLLKSAPRVPKTSP
ncbi:MAG: rane protein [Nocardioides sp.]|nr:rane protein [Nocardioides sp.]